MNQNYIFHCVIQKHVTTVSSSFHINVARSMICLIVENKIMSGCRVDMTGTYRELAVFPQFQEQERGEVDPDDCGESLGEEVRGL